jgi:hypothetical protein
MPVKQFKFKRNHDKGGFRCRERGDEPLEF